MMITIAEGTIATYPSGLRGTSIVQFTLREGKSYRWVDALPKSDAERLACSVALSHPSWKMLEKSENWRPL